MADSDVVTVTLASGTRVTCPRELAIRLGWTPPKTPPRRAKR